MAERIIKDDIIRSLLDAAFSRSTGGTSLSDIANSLGIKKSSLYNHFESREDLINSTTASCSEYLTAINFIPDNYDAVAKKYPLETVFKGIAGRYYKMHEKSPLFQIYTFVESQKYFSPDAAQIVMEEKQKLISQTMQMLESLKDAGKLKIESSQFYGISVWFVSGLTNIISDQLLERKKTVMENPQSGEGQLFTLEPDEKGIEKINNFVDEFCKLI